jgi:hypothetical protein
VIEFTMWLPEETQFGRSGFAFTPAFGRVVCVFEPAFGAAEAVPFAPRKNFLSSPSRLCKSSKLLSSHAIFAKKSLRSYPVPLDILKR